MLPPTPAALPRRAPTPADLLLIACLVAVVLWLPFQRRPATAATHLQVHTDAGTRLLDRRVDADHALTGPAGVTLLRIRDGRAWIAAAPCPREICRRMGPLRSGRGSLICVPNHLVVRVASAADSVDAVTR